jgi:hypothetical protein
MQALGPFEAAVDERFVANPKERKTVMLFSGWKLAETDEAEFIAAFERRAALCREGVDSRDEMGAAEAYLAEAQTGSTLVAIAVKRAKKKRTYTAVLDPSALGQAVAQGFTVYVPERTHRILSESTGAELRPPRGVD